VEGVPDVAVTFGKKKEKRRVNFSGRWVCEKRFAQGSSSNGIFKEEGGRLHSAGETNGGKKTTGPCGDPRGTERKQICIVSQGQSREIGPRTSDLSEKGSQCTGREELKKVAN